MVSVETTNLDLGVRGEHREEWGKVSQEMGGDDAALIGDLQTTIDLSFIQYYMSIQYYSIVTQHHGKSTSHCE